MFISGFKGVKAYVKKCYVGISPTDVRLEMEVVVVDEGGIQLNVCFGIKDDSNWDMKGEGARYKENTIYVPEVDKYTVLEYVRDEMTNKCYKTTPEEKERLKQQIFALCGGEMLLYRSATEEKMFEFFNLTDEEIDARINEFSELFR